MRLFASESPCPDGHRGGMLVGSSGRGRCPYRDPCELCLILVERSRALTDALDERDSSGRSDAGPILDAEREDRTPRSPAVCTGTALFRQPSELGARERSVIDGDTDARTGCGSNRVGS